MAKIYTFEQICNAVEKMDFTAAIEDGFKAYSAGQVIVPPVGELVFDDPPGDTHIKYGYIKQDDYFVIKIASGFYKNIDIGLPSSSGLMLVFSQKTGILDTVLLDDGHLTNIRTAVAGKIAASYMAPENVTAIGVFGTGIMARMQVQILKDIIPCQQLHVWGRSEESLLRYQHDMQRDGYNVKTTLNAAEVTESCNLLLMTTPSTTPLISVDQIRAGTHITAIGSDNEHKQELDDRILANADIVISDSIAQCTSRGEISKALQSGQIKLEQVIELGNAIASGNRIRTSAMQITVADLTGVAVQDIQIAKTVCEALTLKEITLT